LCVCQDNPANSAGRRHQDVDLPGLDE